jgi:hypothetical protein
VWQFSVHVLLSLIKLHPDKPLGNKLLNMWRREPVRTETAGAHGQMLPKSILPLIFSVADQTTVGAEAEAL